MERLGFEMKMLKLSDRSNKVVCFLLILLVMLNIIFLPVPVSAETYSGSCGDNLTWLLDISTGIMEFYGTGDMYDYSSNYPAPWYNYRDSIWQVEIHSGATSIGNYAFYECSSLISITIPEGVTSIGEYAFRVCKSLTNITIPKSVTSIGKLALSYCTSLTSITIPEGVTSIGDQAFAWCSSLASINIPESVTSIDDYAFVYCSSLTNIAIPASATNIGYTAFSNCSSLTNIVIPEGVTSIVNAFNGCTSLSSINIPEGMTSIGNYTFYDCRSLTSITISEDVNYIGMSAFSDCTSLKSVYFRGPIPSFWGASAFSKNATGRKLYYNTYYQDSWSPNGEINRYGYPIAPMPPITDFALDSPMQLGVGLLKRIGVTTEPEHASHDQFTYLSQNPSIASVSNDGIITGRAVGTTYITVTEPTLGTTKLLTVQVLDPVSSLFISGKKTPIEYGESIQLTVAISPPSAHQGFQWLSTNPSVAEVDQAGLVTATGGGFTYINVKAVDGSKKYDSFVLEVIRNPESIFLDKIEVDVYTTNPVQLTATVLPADTSNKNVMWSSSDESVAVVENGLVTAIDNGTALITATTEDGNISTSCQVQCLVNVEEVTLNKSDLFLAIDEKETLVATVHPANAWNKNIIWTSSDHEVATVENGEVTGQGEGTAAIVVSSAEGNYSAMCVVTVYPEETYLAIFDVDGGSPVQTQQIEHGGQMTEPTAPTKAGYLFQGWYKDKALTEAYDFASPVIGPLTLYAMWVKEHTLTYQAGENGSLVGQLIQKVEDGHDGTTVTAISDTGYHFVNWSDGFSTVSRTDTNVKDDLTVTATFALNLYEVFFETNGGSEVTTQEIGHGGLVVEPADPTRTDYTFKGWYQDADLTSSYDFSIEVTEYFTLYAKWEKKSSPPVDPPTPPVDPPDPPIDPPTLPVGPPAPEVKALSEVIKDLTPVSGDYINAPTIVGAEQAVLDAVKAQLKALDEEGITVTVKELEAPKKQADGTTYEGSYRITLKRGQDSASRDLTHTQKKVKVVSFNDVPKSAWYHGYVTNLAEKEIISGFGETGEFRPNAPLTREQAAKMIAEAAGLESEGKTAKFTDVPANSWSTGYIAALVDKGAASGYKGNTKFGPKDNILRSHAAKIVAIAFDLKMGDIKVDLSDLPEDQVLRESIETLASNGIAKGFGTTNEFRPNKEISRAEFSKIITVAMAVSSIQKAEAAKTQASVKTAQAFIDVLPTDQDLETRIYLQRRLDQIVVK